MTQAVIAIYEDGVLRPTSPLSLAEGERVCITIQEPRNGQVPAADDSRADDAETTRDQAARALVQSLLDSKDADDLPDGYDFLEALNANRVVGERPLFPPDQKGVTW